MEVVGDACAGGCSHVDAQVETVGIVGRAESGFGFAGEVEHLLGCG